MKRVLVTGASGFIGRHVVAGLIERGHAVTAMSRKPTSSPVMSAGCTWVTADVREAESLKAVMAGHDMVVNLAAEVSDAGNMTATNVEGTKNLLDAVVANGVHTVVHLSSVGVVGAPYSYDKILIDEGATLTPGNSYETTKAQSEKLFTTVAAQGDIRLTVARPTNVFGEGHPRDALLRLMTRLAGRALVPVGSQAQSNFVYVGDVAGAITHLVDSSTTGTFNVGHPMPLADLMVLIRDVIGGHAPILRIPPAVSACATAIGINTLQPVTNGVAYDDTHLRSEFDYPYGISEGIRRTASDFRRRGLLA